MTNNAPTRCHSRNIASLFLRQSVSGLGIGALLIGMLITGNAYADNKTFNLKLSLGASWQQSNDVQIPNDNTGTRFSLNDLAGSGPWPGVRLEGIWNINDKHGIRLLLAPLSYSESDISTDAINFAGETFNAQQPIQAEYTFNSWRVGYRYHLRAREQWDLWVGGTLKVRDAEIKLTQSTVSSLDDDVGFVPLLHVAGEYRFNPTWTLAADIDALGGGPGRAIDLGVNLNYAISNSWSLGLEYRALEGGADIEQVYNFAWFNSLLLTAQFKL